MALLLTHVDDVWPIPHPAGHTELVVHVTASVFLIDAMSTIAARTSIDIDEEPRIVSEPDSVVCDAIHAYTQGQSPFDG